jgi:hypothetical protein
MAEHGPESRLMDLLRLLALVVLLKECKLHQVLLYVH